MGIFKKKNHQKSTENVPLNCPKEGCSFTGADTHSLNRHVEWKHPELVQEATNK